MWYHYSGIPYLFALDIRRLDNLAEDSIAEIFKYSFDSLKNFKFEQF